MYGSAIGSPRVDVEAVEPAQQVEVDSASSSRSASLEGGEVGHVAVRGEVHLDRPARGERHVGGPVLAPQRPRACRRARSARGCRRRAAGRCARGARGPAASSWPGARGDVRVGVDLPVRVVQRDADLLAAVLEAEPFGLFTGQVGYAVNNVLFYVKGGAAVTSNSYRVNALAARSLASPATTPAGAARSASASNTPSLRTGRLASSTITCSCRTVPTPSPRRAALAFGTDRIRQDVDLVTARLNYKFGGPVVARY